MAEIDDNEFMWGETEEPAAPTPLVPQAGFEPDSQVPTMIQPTISPSRAGGMSFGRTASHGEIPRFIPDPSETDLPEDLSGYGIPNLSGGPYSHQEKTTLLEDVTQDIGILKNRPRTPEVTEKINALEGQVGTILGEPADVQEARLRDEEAQGIQESNIVPWEWFGAVGGAKAVANMGRMSARKAMVRGAGVGLAATAVDTPLETVLETMEGVNPWASMLIGIGVGIPAGNFAETFVDNKTLQLLNRADPNFFTKNMEGLIDSGADVSTIARKRLDQLAVRIDKGDTFALREAQNIIKEQKYADVDPVMRKLDFSVTNARKRTRRTVNKEAMKKSFRDVDDKDLDAIQHLAEIKSWEGASKEFKKVKKRVNNKLAHEAYNNLPTKPLFYRIVRGGGLEEGRLRRLVGDDLVNQLKQRDPKLVGGGVKVDVPEPTTVTGKAYHLAAKSTDKQADIKKFNVKVEEFDAQIKKLQDEGKWQEAMDLASGDRQMYREAAEALQGQKQHAKGLAKAKEEIKKGQLVIDPLKTAVAYDYDDVEEMILDLIEMPTLKKVKGSVARNMAYDWNVVMYDMYADRIGGTELEMWKRMGASDTVKQIRSAIRRDIPEVTADSKTLGTILSETGYMRRVSREAVAAAEKKGKGEQRVKQLLKAERYKDAQKLKQEVINLHGKLRNAINNGGIPDEYQEQIHNLLKPYFKSKSFAGDNVMGIRFFLDEKVAEGVGAAKLLRDEFGDVLELTQRKTDLKQLTMAEYRRLVEFTDAFQDLARNQKKIDRVSKGEAINDYVAEISDTADNLWQGKFAKKTPREELGEPVGKIRGKVEKAKGTVRRGLAAIKRPEFILRELDGWEDFGPAQKMMRSAKMAEDSNFKISQTLTDGWQNTVDDYAKSMGKKKFKAKFWNEKMTDSMGIVPEMTREKMLTIAAMTGNKHNKEAMLNTLGKNVKGEWEPMGEPAINRFLQENMTEQDWGYVKGIWKMTDEMYPMLAETYKRMTGRTLPKVKNYFPIIPDYKFSTKSMEPHLSDAYMDMPSSRQIPAQIQKRFLHERTGGADAVRLDFDAFAKHLRDVSRTVSHWEVTNDINKVINDDKFRKTVTNNLGEEKYNVLKEWSQDLIQPPQTKHRWARWARGQYTVAALGARFSTALVQPLSAIAASQRLGGANVAQSFVELFGNPTGTMKKIDAINQVSEQMATRNQSWQRDIQELMTGEHANKLKKMGTLDRNMFFKFIRMGDTIGAYTTWNAGYIKGMKKYKGDSNKAIAYADQAVRLTQPQSALKDLPKVMRSENEWNRLATMFYSYYSVLHNQAAELIQRGKVGDASIAEVMSGLNYMYVLPPTAKTLMQERSETTPGKVAASVVTHAAGGVPYVRDLMSAAVMGYDYQVTPLQDIGTTAIRTGKEIARQLTDEDREMTAGRWVAPVETGSQVFGLPSGQFINFLRAIEAGNEGEDVNALDYLYKLRKFEDE